MSEVGSLIIKLQCETAEFKNDLGKVKRELDDLKDKSKETGRSMDTSFTESRGGLMLTEDLVGVRLPRHLNTLISQIPGVGALFANMLPIVGVALAVEIISKLIEKHKAAQESMRKLQDSQASFGNAAKEAFNKLDDKLLEAGIKADELTGKHMAALHKQLILIDHQSMHELMTEFDSLADKADKVLANITEHWYESKVGVGGVRSALDTFKQQYDSLLESHKGKDAGDLLAGTLQSAIKAKELMQSQQGGHGSSQSDLDSQNAFIQLLQTEVGLRKENAKVVAKTKEDVSASAEKKTASDRLKLTELAARAKAELNKELEKEAYNYGKIAEERLKSGLEQELKQLEAEVRARKELLDEDAHFKGASAKLTDKSSEEDDKHKLLMHKSSLAQMTQADLDAAQREHDTQHAAVMEELGALTSTGVQLEADQKKIHDRMLLEDQEYQNKKKQIEHKAEEERAKFVQEGEQRIAQSFSRSMAQTLVENKNFGAAMRQLGSQLLETAIQNSIQMLLHEETTAVREQAIHAKSAASSAFASVHEHVPFPLSLVLAPVAAAAAFAGVMAFEQGGEIPGTGAVPIIGHAGETVVTKSLTDQVKRSEGNGKTGGDIHLHHSFNAMDAQGMDAVLKKHSSLVEKHVWTALRKVKH